LGALLAAQAVWTYVTPKPGGACWPRNTLHALLTAKPVGALVAFRPICADRPLHALVALHAPDAEGALWTVWAARSNGAERPLWPFNAEGACWPNNALLA